MYAQGDNRVPNRVPKWPRHVPKDTEMTVKTTLPFYDTCSLFLDSKGVSSDGCFLYTLGVPDNAYPFLPH